MARRLISSEEAVPAKGQHERPCSDCPFSRDSLSGWLGGMGIDDWMGAAHGEEKLDCHVLEGAQCAGGAIYRRNVGKLPRDPEALRLPKDTDTVFASPHEFEVHHDQFFSEEELGYE